MPPVVGRLQDLERPRSGCLARSLANGREWPETGQIRTGVREMVQRQGPLLPPDCRSVLGFRVSPRRLPDSARREAVKEELAWGAERTAGGSAEDQPGKNLSLQLRSEEVQRSRTRPLLRSLVSRSGSVGRLLRKAASVFPRRASPLSASHHVLETKRRTPGNVSPLRCI